ncbi:hypothetical protein LRAMOSA03158 [Lichtheimia ramosa]|uniref:F-box domain-containing protein n=1 Tax=Lichtheimia ramosa TaxID=688394 RepID=A0A077WUZ4_9FUNG|nr:hypothetical protein LRAMOSA03158 [Lichtheimia ramosa]
MGLFKRRRQSNTHSTPKRQHSDQRVDFTSNLLSDELILHIFSFLSANDLTRCAAVNSSWFRLANDELLWKPLFLRRFQNGGGYTSTQQDRRSESRWKTLYRTNHNWRSGNCRITQLDLHDSKQYQQQRQRPLVQFSRDILCLASISDPRIEVWRIATNDNPQPVLLGQLASHDDSSTLSHITCLKLQAMNHSQYRLVAGYDDGGFSLWTMEIEDNPTSFVARQLTRYTPSYRLGCHQAIEAIGLSYPVVLICTKGMKLSAFIIDNEQTAASPRLIYELQSPIRWNPIVVELDQCDNHRDRWRGMACFGMPVGLNAFSVGIQEVVFSSRGIISSRHCTALNEDDFFFTNHARRPSQDALEPITALAYSQPYLMTAHGNNTIKQYHVYLSSDKLELRFAKTLYGHTSRVCALALDASVSRLVSGDRYGLKVWDLSMNDNDKHQPFPNNETDHHSNAYRLARHRLGGNEYLVAIDAGTEHRAALEVPSCDMRWLHFDSDKIVAALRDDSSGNLALTSQKRTLVRIWSFS